MKKSLLQRGKRWRRLYLYLVLAVVFISAGAYLYHTAVNKPLYKEAFLFGTLIRVTAYGPGARAALDRALTEMARIEQEIAKAVAAVNSKAGEEPVEVDAEFFALLEAVLGRSGETGGYFNPAIGPLVEAWEFGPGGSGRLPPREEVEQVLPLLDANGIILDRAAGTIYLSRKGMRLDLGGVAKGYAVDRAWELLAGAGVRGALVNAGESSIRVLGERPGGGPWRVAVSHPREEEWLGILALPSGAALGTSADTQRYIVVDGNRYSHLLNPFTGYPAAELLSVTVITGNAFDADIFSTALFVAEGRDRLELLDRWGAEGIMVTASGARVETPGLARYWYEGNGPR
ncbi:MAG: FAD:protein FMN transferase [Firmicutes bacterium]|jgi:thiamine biosynthesis lipoprotein|nr:FAD:protein FMN transferase [Bacillota bacterium]